eukprot:114153_1
MRSPGYNEEEVDEDSPMTMEGVTLMGGQTQSYIESDEKKADTNSADDDEDLFIGNLHKLSDIHQYQCGNTSHRWDLFISASKDKLVKPQSIKQVTYYLH